MPLSDETLIAYVDGELSPEQIREVEVEIAADAGLAATVDSLRQGSAILRAAYNDSLHAPVPARLSAAIAAAPASAKVSSVRHGFGRVLAGPLAASILVLAVGLGGAYVFAEWQVERKIARLEAIRAADQKMLAAAVSMALESNVSGKTASWRNPDSGSNGTVEPVRTFRAVGGQWCREYIQTADLATESFQSERLRGIACRDPDGQWRTRAEMREASY